MTTMLIQELAQRLNTSKAMESYLRARLSGDARNAPPPIDQYHGVEDYEDILIALARDDVMTSEQRNWFWTSVYKIAFDAWNKADAQPFGRIALLAWRVGAPPNGRQQLDFLPFDSDGFQWHRPARMLVGAHALLWLLVWQARPETSFWRNNAESILRVPHEESGKYLALVRAIDGVGVLDVALWRGLLRDALRATDMPTSMLRTALLAQWRLAGGDGAAELEAIRILGQSLAQTREDRDLPEAWLSLQSLLQEWRQVPWSEPASRQLDVLLRENRLLDLTSEGRPKPRRLR